MDDVQRLMIELDGADADTVNAIAWKHGSLLVRLAMLGLASLRKGESPLWYGYPPGVFISYKWEGARMRDLVSALAGHARESGYRVFLDAENLGEDADAYFQIPQFIASLQDCTFYVLLLTGSSAEFVTASTGKTSWIHDEYQHAVRLANSGRLIIVPVLLEANGLMSPFDRTSVIDLTDDHRDFAALDPILSPGPKALSDAEVQELRGAMAEFDARFLKQQWDDADRVLRRTKQLGHAFDHQFRRMLHSIYTANGPALATACEGLFGVYGKGMVVHMYKGYCARHGIPNRLTSG
jgi:hypothetical protein